MKHDTKNDTAKHEEPKNLQQANENIRKAEGDEPADSADETSSSDRKTGNKPAIDRGR